MVIGYHVRLLASGAAMNAYQAPRASTAGAASQANAPRRGRSQLSTLQVEPAAAKNRASDARMKPTEGPGSVIPEWKGRWKPPTPDQRPKQRMAEPTSGAFDSSRNVRARAPSG